MRVKEASHLPGSRHAFRRKRKQMKWGGCRAGGLASFRVGVAGGEGARGRVKAAADTRLTLESVVESWKDEFLS